MGGSWGKKFVGHCYVMHEFAMTCEQGGAGGN